MRSWMLFTNGSGDDTLNCHYCETEVCALINASFQKERFEAHLILNPKPPFSARIPFVFDVVLCMMNNIVLESCVRLGCRICPRSRSITTGSPSDDASEAKGTHRRWHFVSDSDMVDCQPPSLC
jgi:hypothetical protein